MKRFWIGLCAACVFGLCAAGTVWVIRSQIQARAMRRFMVAGPANLAREQAAARAAGIPLSAAQLQQPLPPVLQNAAPLYVKLTKLLHDRPMHLPKYAESMDAFHTYTPAQVAAARKILADRPDVMTLVHQAADRPRCVFVHQWNQGINLTFPEYPTVRASSRLLKTESYLLARDRHYSQAVANQSRGFRVAEHAASDHVLIAYLVGVACEANTFSGMQSILTLAGPDAIVDADVQAKVTAEHSRLSLRDAMAGEAGFDCTPFVPMHQHEGDGVEAALKAAGFGDEDARKVQVSDAERQNLHALIDAWEADYLARMRPAVVASDQPPAARRAAFALMEEQVTQDASSSGGAVHAFSDILLPAFGKIDQHDTRMQAREMVTLAAADLLAERANAGAYPDRLPTGFTDPFSGQPLQYRREGAGGFVVYSVGPTGRFGGGRPGQKVPGVESLFRCPAVP